MKMDRARLALLATCALLTTTIDPFGWAVPNGHATTNTGPTAQPTASSLPATEDASARASSATNGDHDSLQQPVEPGPDAQQIAAILKRLSIRHTALPRHERIALARTIVREARAQNLEPDLVVSVIEVESAGYHLAVSHVGAMGLMQILPSTGEELANKHDVDWKGPDTLFDPTINVKLGTAYLRQLTDRYGDVNTALAAYNWGPGSIDRRLRRGASVPSKYIEQVRRAYDRHATPPTRRS